MVSITGHRNRYLLVEDKSNDKVRKYCLWEEDNNKVMSWILNGVQPQLPAYFRTAKEMWELLEQNYFHYINISKFFQLEEELSLFR